MQWQGLSRDTFGRRFIISEHPRFEEICASRSPVRFDSDSSLPDPFDGLLIDHDGRFTDACLYGSSTVIW